MVGSRVFWRIVPGYALVVAATALVVGVGVGRRMEQSTLREVEVRLLEGISALGELEAAGPSDLQAAVRRLGLGTEIRYTILAADGTVRADSDHEPAVMENHAGRPEVLEARANGTGMARRRSSTIGVPLMYVAVREDDGFLRTAMPLDVLERRRAGLRSNIALAVAAALAVGVVLGLVVSHRFAAPLVEMSRTARRIAAGDVDRRIPIDREDEIGVLGRAVNLLASEAQRRVRSITEDRDRLQTILAGMVEGVVAVDLEERVVLLNKVAGRFLAADPEMARGRPIRSVTRVVEIADALAATLRSGIERRQEIRIEAAQGVRTVEMHAGPFGASGEVQGAVVVLHDVTELRRLEAVRRDFVANVSHELKTPLTAVRGMLETMVDDPAMPADVRDSFLERMALQTERLTGIVTDLLGLARVESDPEELARDRLDLREVVEETRRALSGAADDRKISFVFELPPMPVPVLGDRPSLRLLVDNLVDNALKYTPLGGHVSIRLTQDRDGIALSVKDDGIGIDARHGDRIFERFYRVDPSRSRALGSTGLGLAIVRHVAAAHGGTVAYDSVPGRGTEFRVRLPLAGEAAA